MFFSGPWHLGLIKDAGGAGFEGKWAIAPMPKKVTATSFVGGSNLVVYKDSENKDAGLGVRRSTCRIPKTQVDWYKDVTDLPAVQAAWDDPALKDDPNVAMFGEQLKDTKAQPAIATWSEVAYAHQLDAREDDHREPSTRRRPPTRCRQEAEKIGDGQLT